MGSSLDCLEGGREGGRVGGKRLWLKGELEVVVTREHGSLRDEEREEEKARRPLRSSLWLLASERTLRRFLQKRIGRRSEG